MGERRKRKSQWDMDDDPKHLSGMSEHRQPSHDSGHYHDFSAPRTITPKTRDNSEWPSWDTIEENPNAPMNGSYTDNRQNVPAGKEMDGGKRYFKNMSPGFDGMESRDYNHSHEYDQSHSQRYPARGRSRSRSRSRSRTRGRSRSLSRGRARERGRSRSRSRGNAKGPTRSRSPVGDYRRQSCAWNDRRSGPDKICRDFTSGSCRRGNECRFSHSNSTNYRDGDFMEDDRADYSRMPKRSYSRGSSVHESRNEISDPYQREDVQFVNKSRNAIPCKDFVRGKCRWGDTCRFSHHAASDDINTFGKGNRNASFDKDIERQPYKERKPPLCKYFAAGKCDRDNCRFSHDDPNFKNVEPRQDRVLDNTYEKSNVWNGPTWDDETRVSNTMKSTGWGETIVPNTNSVGETNNGKNDDNCGFSLDDPNFKNVEPRQDRVLDNTYEKSNVWNGPTRGDETRVSNTMKSTGWGETIVPNTNSVGETNNGKNDDRGEHSLENDNKSWEIPEYTDNSSKGYGGPTIEPIGEDNMAHKQEHHILHGSQLQNQDGIVNARGNSALQENMSLSVEANVYPAFDIQKEHGRVVENNVINSFGSDVVDVGKDPRYMAGPILFSGQSLNQSGGSMITSNSSISNETNREQNMISSYPSSGFSTGLNVLKTNVVGNLSLQTQTQNNQRSVQSPVILETPVPQFLPSWNNSAVSNPNVSPVTNPKAFLAQRFENEQSQIHVANVHPNLVAVSVDTSNPIEKSIDNDDQMQPHQSAPLSTLGAVFDSSKVGHPESSKPGQEVIADPEGNKAIGGGSKGGAQENKRSENLDGHVKVEEGNANKDEKVMRNFKNALIEFVKEILKPTWKEGRMSREVHKTVVKKVVDKVSSTVPADRMPTTQDKIEQYLASSKPKISKLVQAYVERSLKADPNVV